MKKSLKVLALGLAVVPCAIMFTGCGGETHIVDTTGTYSTPSSYQSAETYIQTNSPASTEFDSYRMILRMDISGKFAGYKMTVSADSDTIIQEVEEGVYNASSKTTAKASLMGYSATEKSEIYVRENTAYMKESGQWFNTVFDVESQQNQSLTYDKLLAQIEEGTYGPIDVFIDESETAYKIKMVLSSEALSSFAGDMTAEMEEFMPQDSVFTWQDAEIYFVFDANHQFVGSTMSMAMTYTHPEYGGSFSLEMEFAPYEGEVTFPADLPDSL